MTDPALQADFIKDVKEKLKSEVQHQGDKFTMIQHSLRIFGKRPTAPMAVGVDAQPSSIHKPGEYS